MAEQGKVGVGWQSVVVWVPDHEAVVEEGDEDEDAAPAGDDAAGDDTPA